jgi:predicted secreted hydrolase
MKRILIIVGLLGLGVFGFIAVRSTAKPEATQSRIVAGSTGSIEGYARVGGPREMVFPQDAGPHDEYQTEWWYYTGNLETAEGRHFGYQLTFFRRALLPEDQQVARESDLATTQIYFAHFALTDVSGGGFHAFERFSRGAGGLAGAEASPYRVWLEDWQVTQKDDGVYSLRAAQDDLSITIDFVDQKGPVLQGDRGYSPKGPNPGNASIYYSLTRLESSGSVSVDGRTYEVSGLSWMDHEFSTSALGPGQVGWDWFSIQLDDGSELMVFQLRRDDGSVDPYSGGTYIAADGTVTSLKREDFTLTPQGTWRSPRSGGVYPGGWNVSVPSLALTLRVDPYVADQELNVSFAYWEGAVRITGEKEGNEVEGSGYLEMTGYAASMEGQF